jgi:serine/threonine protein kinase
MNHVDSCLTESVAVRVLAGALRGSETEAVRQHLDGCDLCSRLIGEAARDTGDEETGWRERIRPRVLLPGMVLSARYNIRRLLGIGAMGEVHEAEDALLGEVVAIKTLNAKLAGKCEALARLKVEVATAHRVTHPNVCRIFDFGEDKGEGTQGTVVFLTMEYLPGTTLSAHLKTRGRLSASEALPILAQLAQGLSAAHAAQVVHRDLKSENVMLVPSPAGQLRAVITDFGLADRVLDDRGAALGRKDGFSGTLAYAAPERLAGGRATPASDVFSFGVLAYEMLTGRVSPAPPEVDLSALPIRWQRFISHAVQPDPRRRLSDGAALVAALGVFGPVSPRSVTKYAPAVLAVVSLVVISSTVEWRRSTAAKLVAVAGGKATVANVLRPSISPPEVPPKQELVASTNPRAISRVVHVRSESASEGRVRQDPARRTVERSTHPLAPPSPASELLREVQFHRPAGGGADALPDPFLVDPFSVNHDRNSTR